MSQITERIQEAAYARLLRKFDEQQAEILARFIVAQAAHETGNFKSDAFVKNNNIGGYKPYSGSIWQVYPIPTGANRKYAYYSNVENSANELADWLGRRDAAFKNVQTTAGYAIALRNNGYYEDTVGNYTSGLDFWFTSIFSDATSSISSIFSGDKKRVDIPALIIGALITGFITWVLRKFIFKSKR